VEVQDEGEGDQKQQEGQNERGAPEQELQQAATKAKYPYLPYTTAMRMASDYAINCPVKTMASRIEHLRFLEGGSTARTRQTASSPASSSAGPSAFGADRGLPQQAQRQPLRQSAATASVYHYAFGYTPLGSINYATPNLTQYLGAFHGAEVPLVLNTPTGVAPNDTRHGAAEQLLALQMGCYWANFIISGDPNSRDYRDVPEPRACRRYAAASGGRKLVHWPTFREERPHLLSHTQILTVANEHGEPPGAPGPVSGVHPTTSFKAGKCLAFSTFAPLCISVSMAGVHCSEGESTWRMKFNRFGEQSDSNGVGETKNGTAVAWRWNRRRCLVQ